MDFLHLSKFLQLLDRAGDDYATHTHTHLTYNSGCLCNVSTRWKVFARRRTETSANRSQPAGVSVIAVPLPPFNN